MKRRSCREEQDWIVNSVVEVIECEGNTNSLMRGRFENTIERGRIKYCPKTTEDNCGRFENTTFKSLEFNEFHPKRTDEREGNESR